MVACRYCSESLYNEKNENDKYVPTEVSTREPHDCPERQNIYEDRDGNSFETGRSSGSSSNYGSSSSSYYDRKETLCNYYNKRIKFDPNVKSKAGKFIPLTYDTGEKHSCTQNPYYKNKRGSSGSSNYNIINNKSNNS